MYTRAKEIGGKVMARGENNMLKPAASRCGQVYGHLSVRIYPKEADTVAKRCLPLISLTSPRLSLSCSYRESRA